MTEELKKIRKIVEKARFAMFTTIDADGKPTARPMTVQEVGDDWKLLFIAQRDSEVTQQAQGNAVELAFADGMDFVSLQGEARINDDVEKKKELWNPANDAYTEGGAENPDNIIIEVNAESARYWDSPAGPVALVSMLTAAVTGNKPGPGEYGEVEL